MALIGRLVISIAALLLGTTPSVIGQSIRGAVLGGQDRRPIAQASIAVRGTPFAAATDRFGRFGIAVPSFPATLVVAAIGWKPDTIEVAAATDTLTVALDRTAFVVAELIMTAAPTPQLDLANVGRWRLPIATVRSIPPAVEPDVYRALAMVPAISFSSPLSARPSLRGYDGQEVGTRIDGFEVLNLYHLGRVFSSFPADAADEISVTPAPFTGNQTGSIAGLIDIHGRSGRDGDTEAGGSWSFGSLSAYAGGGNERIRYFGAARAFYWKALDLVPGVSLPYHFEDLYAAVDFGPPSRAAGRLTIFATRDRAGDGRSHNYLDWDNVLVGGRWRLVDRGRTSIEISSALTRFRETGRDVPGLHSVANADIANLFARATVGVDLVTVGVSHRAAVGMSAGYRRVDNEITPTDGQAIERAAIRFPTSRTSFGRPELGGYLEASRRLGTLTLEASARADAAGTAVTVQPRLHARWSPHPILEVRAAVGRSTRLFHLLSESRSEPDFDFLDFWRSTGDSIPLARTDVATLDVEIDLAPIAGRLSLYRSRGSGVGELRPDTDDRVAPFDYFRFGASRTIGLEAQVALRGTRTRPARSASVSYVWSRSERRWNDRWVPWILDRRHQVRAFGQVRRGAITLYGAFDWATGTPLTPAEATIRVSGVPAGTEPISGAAVEATRYGFEGSAASSGTVRVDGGVSFSFGGTDRSRFTIGLAVVNLLGTAVAPFTLSGEGRAAVDPSGAPTPYARLFDLPPIPTVTVRVQF